MLGRAVTEMLPNHGPRYPWGDAPPRLTTADLTFVNLACVMAAHGVPWPEPTGFYFRADPVAIPARQEAGVDFVALATTHAMDFQAEGLRETMARAVWDDAGLEPAGAGRDLATARRAAWLHAHGVRVAVWALTDNEPRFAAAAHRPGTNDREIEPSTLDLLGAQVAARRAAGADVGVCSMHWGPTMTPDPPTRFQQFAPGAVDAGVDVFHGHRAHVFHAVEVDRGRPILYDTGDLVDDDYVSSDVPNDLQLLVLVGMSPAGVAWLHLVPLRIAHAHVNRARDTHVADVPRLVRERSRPFGTRYEMLDDRVVLDLSTAKGRDM